MKPFVYALSAGVVALSGAAIASEKSYSETGFTRIAAAAGVDVVIEVGDDFAIVAETEEGDFDHLVVQLSGDTLKVKVDRKKRRRWKREHEFVVRISLPSLVGLDVSSGADVVAKGIDSDMFELEVSSGADADVSGRCGEAEIDVSSGADAHARGLECRIVRAEASSGSDAIVFASEEVEADASSGGDVTVYGGPRIVDIDTSSGGDVSIRN